MSKSYSWHPLALLPILKSSACKCTNPSAAFLRYRRLDLYHRCMEIVKIKQFCDKVFYIWFADNKISKSQCFLHFFWYGRTGGFCKHYVIYQTMSKRRCYIWHAGPLMDNTVESFPIRNSVTVQKSVKTAQDEHKQVKVRCKKQIRLNIQ